MAKKQLSEIKMSDFTSYIHLKDIGRIIGASDFKKLYKFCKDLNPNFLKDIEDFDSIEKDTLSKFLRSVKKK